MNAFFEPLARREELDFLAVGRADDYQEMVRDPDLWNGRKGVQVYVSRIVRPVVRGIYETLAAQYVAGETIVVASFMAFGARIAHDKLGVPLVTIYSNPADIRSVHRESIGPGFFFPRWLPLWCRRLCYRGVDRLADRELAPEINALRAELGLPLVQRVLNTWCHSPQRVLGLFPDWFCPLQPDWPPQTRLTDFPLYSERDEGDLPAALLDFLAQGEPPIVFTAGTAMAHGRDFFQASVEACRLTGRRGLLLTRFADQVPTPLPEGVRLFDYISLARLLPRTAAFVHHGGISTTAQALAAGIPQLVVPIAVDQPDNAALVQGLGVARTLRARAYSASAAAQALQELLTSPAIAQQCQSLAARIHDRDPVEATCQAIENVAKAAAR
jgi:UDP:flavonoid glycosyltransferase YjiC (YdhE family)